MAATAEQVLAASAAERAALESSLWGVLCLPPFEMTDELRASLDAALAEYEANPKAAVPAHEALARIQEKHGLDAPRAAEPVGQRPTLGTIDFADIQVLPREQQVELELLLLRSLKGSSEPDVAFSQAHWDELDRLLSIGRREAKRLEEAIGFLRALRPEWAGFDDP
jgi:hypothetical protein